MQAIIKHATVTVAIAGDGGYANQSDLILDVEGIGKVTQVEVIRT